MSETSMPEGQTAIRLLPESVGATSRQGSGLRNSNGRRVPACTCLLALFTLLSPSLVYGQRLQTYEGEGRQPILGTSGPDAPVSDWDSVFDPLRIDIGTNVTLPHDKKFYGVTAIAMQEKGDEGCKVELYGNLLDPDEPSSDILLERKAGSQAGRQGNPAIIVEFESQHGCVFTLAAHAKGKSPLNRTMRTFSYTRFLTM